MDVNTLIKKKHQIYLTNTNNMKIEIPITRLIYNILSQNAEARDNWMLTIQKIHETEMTIKGIKTSDYFDAFFNEELSNVHTIKRMWQKVQEDFPSLRGVTWEERQRQGGKMAKDMVIDLSQMTLFNDNELNELALLDKDKRKGL